MLTISKTAPNRIDIELKGSLTAENMRTGLEELIAKSEDVVNGHMLYKIPEFVMPTLGALAVELQFLPRLFALLGKFKRCAVLSDAGWLRTAAEIEGALIPGIVIKSFELNDVQAAEDWLLQD